jgi:predicted XRE-type DNA-binding protein
MKRLSNTVEDITMGDQQARPLQGFDKYLITETGSIIVKATQQVRKLQTDKQGYAFIVLLNDSKDGNKYASKSVHRLVALEFLANPDNKPEVNHIDGNKLNNCVTNLEWVTRKENMKHAKEHGLLPQGEKHSQAKLKEKEVREICSHLVNGELEQAQIAELYSVSRQTVTNIATKHRWSYISDEFWQGKLQRLVARRTQ